jgi:hypothetical protein
MERPRLPARCSAQQSAIASMLQLDAENSPGTGSGWLPRRLGVREAIPTCGRRRERPAFVPSLPPCLNAAWQTSRAGRLRLLCICPRLYASDPRSCRSHLFLTSQEHGHCLDLIRCPSRLLDAARPRLLAQPCTFTLAHLRALTTTSSPASLLVPQVFTSPHKRQMSKASRLAALTRRASTADKDVVVTLCSERDGICTRRRGNGWAECGRGGHGRDGTGD